MTVVDPIRDDRGWRFGSGFPDPVNGWSFLSEGYFATEPGFKCNLRRIADYPALQPYLRDLYQHPGIAETVDFDHIKRHYYGTHKSLNPTGIIPAGPVLELAAANGRG